MNQRLSSLRLQLGQLQQRLPDLLQASLDRHPLLPGKLYTLRRKCGKPSCRCTRGSLHESTILSYRGQGRSQNVSPPLEHLDAIRSMTEPYRQCKQMRAQLRRWFAQLLQLVDALHDGRIHQGTDRFDKLRADAAKPPTSRS